MQLLKDHTDALRSAIEATGRILLFQRAVQLETPGRGLVQYDAGDTLKLTDADLADAATCREVARLCAYAPESGPQRARAALYEKTADLKDARAAILEQRAAADEQHQADAEASRGWATIVRGAQTGRDAEDIVQENDALRGELQRQTDRVGELAAANAELADRLTALEAAVAAGAGADAQADLPRDPDATPPKSGRGGGK